LEPSFNRKPVVLKTIKQQFEENTFPNKAIHADCLGCCYVVRQQQIGGKAVPIKAVNADAWDVLVWLYNSAGTPDAHRCTDAVTI
jgi:hypothetical protein